MEGRPPWPGVCETCHTFSPGGIPIDTLDTRLRIMVEPTLSCNLACPSCRRPREGRERTGAWDLAPSIFEALVASCAKSNIEVEEIHYLGWGEPFLYPELSKLTHIARHWQPHCVQEVTSSGSVEFYDYLEDADLDRLIISCDGVRQESYVQYRRNGSIAKVFKLMSNLNRFRSNPFTEWKYILFEHNDTDEDILFAQDLAKQFALDSLLFIITHSKKASKRFTARTIAEFPIKHQDLVTISPAAGIMTIKHAGRILPKVSVLGDRGDFSLFVDQAHITISDILELRGWALRSDGRYVDRIDCYHGLDLISTAYPRERRRDVPRHRRSSVGPDCGFVFKIPLKPGVSYSNLNLNVVSEGVTQCFTLVIEFDL